MARRDSVFSLIEAGGAVEATSTESLIRLTQAAARARVNREPDEYRAVARELAAGWGLEAKRDPIFITDLDRRMAVAAGRDRTKASGG
jgi:hypothetical protein